MKVEYREDEKGQKFPFMEAKTNSAYEEYMQEQITLEHVEIIGGVSHRLYRGRVMKNVHPEQRRANSQVRTASFHKPGDIIEINESWFL